MARCPASDGAGVRLAGPGFYVTQVQHTPRIYEFFFSALPDWYFAEPVDPAEAAWQLLLVRAAPGGPSAIVVKAHHALGDSYALISALSGLFDPQDPRPRSVSPRGPGGFGGTGSPSKTRGAGRIVPPMKHGAGTALRVVRGLAGMSLAAPPSLIGVDGGVAGHYREFAAVNLDARMVAIKARLLGAGTVDFVLAVAADALGQLMAERGQAAVGRTVRAMVPCSLRSAGRPPGRGGAPVQAATSGEENGDGTGQETGPLACCWICPSDRCHWSSGWLPCREAGRRGSAGVTLMLRPLSCTQ